MRKICDINFEFVQKRSDFSSIKMAVFKILKKIVTNSRTISSNALNMTQKSKISFYGVKINSNSISLLIIRI